LTLAIKDAENWAENDIRRNEHHGNYYTGTFVSLDRSQMLSLLRTYNFNQTAIAHGPAFERYFTNQARDFSCSFNYSDKHYLLTFSFTTLEQVNTKHGYVPIHISQRLIERADSPVTNVTTYGPFNNTAIFFNDLSSPATIEVSSKDGGIPDTITLLPNKMQDLGLTPNWTRIENTIYHYKVREYPWIEGDISVSRGYDHGCMSEEAAKSLYAQRDFQVRFPSYLPAGFKLDCIAENTGSYVIQMYVNQTATAHYKSKGIMYSKDNPYPYHLDGSMPEEDVRGIVQVHAQKYYLDSENPREREYRAYRSMLNNTTPSGYITNPQFFDNYANDTSYLTFNEGKFLSVVDVLTSDESYRVVGALPMEEAMNIAKSLSREVK
jgi:hypothetical protein